VKWRVTEVALAEGPVQAFVVNDPAYLGQVMIVAGKRLSWAPPSGPTTATLDDVCTGAATMRLAGTRLVEPLKASALRCERWA
jgi:ABC-type sugar transport system substrate-binding protein